MESESGIPENDLDTTDELPVLSEDAIVAAGGVYPEFARSLEDEDGAVPLRRPDAPAVAEGGDDEPRAADATAGARHATADTTARWPGLEAVLDANAKAIEMLQAELAESRRDLRDSQNRYLNLVTDLAARPANGGGAAPVEPSPTDGGSQRAGKPELARTAELERTLDAARGRIEALENELAGSQSQVGKLERLLADAPERGEARPHEASNLRARIADLEQALVAASARGKELARELDMTRARLEARENALAASQTGSSALEKELADARVEGRELKAALESAQTNLSSAKPPPDLLTYLDRIESLEDYIAGRNDRWEDMEATVASQEATIAELERELEHRLERQRDLERRLHEETRTADVLRQQLSARDAGALSDPAAERSGQDLRGALTAAHSELDQARDEVVRLERKLALAAPMPLSEPEPSTPASDRADVADDATVVALDKAAGAERDQEAPVLLCVTSDKPTRYVLDRPELRIGRGPDCDIRIDTHFVSREHAGLVRDNGQMIIEDRDSTNGVFVNAIRIDRKALEHGDWVTIGETQFRYLSGEA